MWWFEGCGHLALAGLPDCLTELPEVDRPAGRSSHAAGLLWRLWLGGMRWGDAVGGGWRLECFRVWYLILGTGILGPVKTHLYAAKGSKNPWLDSCFLQVASRAEFVFFLPLEASRICLCKFPSAAISQGRDKQSVSIFISLTK